MATRILSRKPPAAVRPVNSLRPLLALDVDDPLALMGEHRRDEVFERELDQIPLVFSRNLPGLLSQLHQHFRILWSSAWGRRASFKLAPMLGLPVGLPYIQFDKYSRSRPDESYKLPGLRARLKNEPAAVVEDEVGDDLRQWASTRPHTFLLQVDPRLGLQESQVKELVLFASRFQGTSVEP